MPTSSNGPSNSEAMYRHLLTVEAHWTAQLQNQQQRAGSVLTVNGLLLSFLGFAGLGSVLKTWETAPTVLFAVALFLLALALGFGTAALWPKIDVEAEDSEDAGWATLPTMWPQSGEAKDAKEPVAHWLDAAYIQKLGQQPGDIYKGLADLISADLTGKHRTVLRFRRALLRWQIRFIAAGLLMLTLAFGWQLPSSI